MIRMTRTMLVLLTGLLLQDALHADEVRIAVAANFSDTIRKLVPLFSEVTGHTARISAASTGKLYSQIKNGAPFDVFLAADTARPIRAEQQQLVVPGSRFVYAQGRLVLWSTSSDVSADCRMWQANTALNHVAIANPKTAPYGVAARQAMEHLGIWKEFQTRLVRGESIAQTFQFVATGNAEAGFVALSQLRNWQGEPGMAWEVPAAYYTPIDQSAVLLTRGKSNAAARAFIEFLKSDTARSIIRDFGYSVPEPTASEAMHEPGCCTSLSRPEPWNSTGSPSG